MHQGRFLGIVLRHIRLTHAHTADTNFISPTTNVGGRNLLWILCCSWNQQIVTLFHLRRGLVEWRIVVRALSKIYFFENVLTGHSFQILMQCLYV